MAQLTNLQSIDTFLNVNEIRILHDLRKKYIIEVASCSDFVYYDIHYLFKEYVAKNVYKNTK